MLTATQFAVCTGCSLPRAVDRLPYYQKAMALYAIDRAPVRVAYFLANVGWESGHFQWSREIWGPTPQQRRYERDMGHAWPPTAADRTNQLAFELGNSEPGDGRRCRGWGDIQNTGRANLARLVQRLRARHPDMQVPDLLAPDEDMDALSSEPQWTSLAAADYVDMKNANAQADVLNFDAYADLVNIGRVTAKAGDANGYAGRFALLQRGLAALGMKP